MNKKKLISLKDFSDAGWDLSFFKYMKTVEKDNVEVPSLFHHNPFSICYLPSRSFDVEARRNRIRIRDSHWQYCFLTCVSKMITDDESIKMNFSKAVTHAFIGGRQSNRNSNPKSKKVKTNINYMSHEEKVDIIKSFL